MKRIRTLSFLVALSLSGPLFSCSKSKSLGRINFHLGEGERFADSFSTDYLLGTSNTPILEGLPKAEKDGFYFVGWREKTRDGSLRSLQTHPYTNPDNPDDPRNGTPYYYYPYGTDDLYAHFEPLLTIQFDLNAPEGENASFVAPKETNEDYADGRLSGYLTKSILSLSLLPTATADHMSFVNWYVDYPIASVTDEETKTKHDVLQNVSGVKGNYSFREAFGGRGMTFPEPEDGSKVITLYAQWRQDPTVRVHVGLDDETLDFSFQTRDEPVGDEILSGLKERIPDATEKEGRIYALEDNERKLYRYRLGGIYTDPAFKEVFPFDGVIGEEDIDLYLRWEKRIDVTFDYNGGSRDGKTSEVVSDHYENDVLPALSSDPVKDRATFRCYLLEGKTFRFNEDPLPDHDITLLAQYEEAKVLRLSVKSPSSYPDASVFETLTYETDLSEGSDLSTALDDFEKQALAKDSTLESWGYQDSTGTSFTRKTMPGQNLDLVLVLAYPAYVELQTYASADMPLEGVPATKSSSTYGKDRARVDIETAFPGSQQDLTLSGSTYLFDGYYFDAALSQKTESFSGESSTSERPLLTLYRKMVRGVTLTFTGDLTGTCVVLPGSSFEASKERIAQALGLTEAELSSYRFYVGTQQILTLLPSNDTVVRVEKIS